MGLMKYVKAIVIMEITALLEVSHNFDSYSGYFTLAGANYTFNNVLVI